MSSEAQFATVNNPEKIICQKNELRSVDVLPIFKTLITHYSLPITCMWFSLLTALGLGFLYFISAIPASVLAGAPLWAATFLAWLGYCLGGAVVLMMGSPLREWLRKKWNFSFTPNPEKLFWRIWERYGMAGLGVIAPITIGPQLSALLLLALGMKPQKILWWVSIGAIPWALAFAVAVKYGFHCMGVSPAYWHILAIA